MKYCPKCRSMFEDWVTKCSDCDVELTGKLPEEPEQESIKYRKLMQVRNAGDVAFIKSLFEANSITYYVDADISSKCVICIQPATIMVDERQYDDAKELTKDLKIDFNRF